MLSAIGVPRGVPTKVGELIDATGTDDARPFSVVGVPGAVNTVRCQAIGTFTVFNGNLELSSDAGTTWAVYVAFDFVANNVFSFDAAPGIQYRFSVSNLTQSVKPNIFATLT